MAELQLIDNQEVGIKKEIDSGAIDLVFQAIQEDIYSHPIKSFVRESISNGIDAITERQIASDILKGKAKVEDHYLDRQDGKLLKDSSFNPDYYDLKYLHNIDQVKVIYGVREGRDIIHVKDYGVGLGGSRLKGFFALGYSSKRNMKATIGKFGAGAKAGLATGVEFFTMTTVYNGYKTSFMIYKTDYEPITPEHPNGRKEDWEVTMANETKQTKTIWWEPTFEKNGVTISLEVKKHNRQAFIDAVKNQFQYFKGKVVFTHPKMYSGDMEIDQLNGEVLYESDNLIIPKYSTYSSPHILVDNIAYGLISWEELELERRTGRIAIKVKANEVDITQSRETLKWTEKTKKTVLNKVKLSQAEASEYITSKLDMGEDEADNLFKTVRKYSVISKDSSDSVSSVFSRFLDMHDIRGEFKFELPLGENVDGVDLKAYIGTELFDFLFYKHTLYYITTRSFGDRVKLEKNKITSFDAFNRNVAIVSSFEAPLGLKRAVHIMNDEGVDGLIYIKNNSTRVKTAISLEDPDKEYPVKYVEKYTNTLLEKYTRLIDNEEWEYDEEDVELTDDDADQSIAKNRVDYAAIRRRNKEVLYTWVKWKGSKYSWNSASGYNPEIYREKVTVKIADIPFEFKDKPVVFTQEYRPLVDFLFQLRTDSHRAIRVPDFVQVAVPVLKHILPHSTFITDYFRQINEETGELMVGEALRDFNTIRKTKELLKSKFGDITHQDPVPQLFESTDKSQFKQIRGSRNLTMDDVLKGYNPEIRDNVLEYLDNLAQFQDIVATGNRDDIATAAQNMFSSDRIYAVDAYDKDFIDSLEGDLDRISTIGPLLNNLESSLSEESVELLKEFITYKHNQDADI